MIACPHCGSHDVTECPEYAMDDFCRETGVPQLHAFCRDCGNEFDPNDRKPRKQHTPNVGYDNYHHRPRSW